MTDPVQEARQKLIHIRFKLGQEAPPQKPTAVAPVPPPPITTTPTERTSFLGSFIANTVGAQVKRAITLGVGVLVGAGYLTVAQGNEYSAALAAIVSQIVLSVAYAAYDKFLKAHVLKLLGANA